MYMANARTGLYSLYLPLPVVPHCIFTTALRTALSLFCRQWKQSSAGEGPLPSGQQWTQNCNGNSGLQAGLLPLPSSGLHLQATWCPVHLLLLSQRSVVSGLGGIDHTIAEVRGQVLKYELVHVSPLLKALLWFSSIQKRKPKNLNMALQAPCDLTPACLPLSLQTSGPLHVGFPLPGCSSPFPPPLSPEWRPLILLVSAQTLLTARPFPEPLQEVISPHFPSWSCPFASEQLEPFVIIYLCV